MLKGLVESGVEPSDIAYLSHTRAAAEVIKERIQEAIPGVKDKDLQWFRTIHGACAKSLKHGGGIVGPPHFRQFSDLYNMKLTPQSDIDDFTDPSEADPDYNIVLAVVNLAEATFRSVDEVCQTMPMHINLVPERRDLFIKSWKDFKRDHNLIDFTDMLLNYLHIGEIEALPCSVVFLDEAQDLSELQWRVFDKMCGNAKRVYLAGDDDQAIYGFIGGSEYGFLERPAQQEHVLRQSHRVPQLIGQRAEKIIKGVQHRRAKEVIWKAHPGDVSIYNLDPHAMPWRSWQNKSVMVLNRHRRGMLSFSGALKEIGVSHATMSESLQSSKEASVVKAYLTIRGGGKLRPILISPMLKAMGIDDRDLRAQGTRDRKFVVGKDALPRIDWNSPDWPSLFSGYNFRLEQRYKAVRELVRMNGLEVLGQEPKINVTTMHAAKGKEADVVILIPDCTEIVKRNIFTPSEIRLAYVALTRAKEDAIIMTPRTQTYINHLVNL
jgi:superfamily I DNA/RNA helicase